jgi:uncharacterized protein YdeI (YjbR/CyaY-like superfamily)
MKHTLFYTSIIFASVAMMALMFMKQCNPQPQTIQSDSTSIWKQQAKQAGNAAAIYMTEVSRLNKRLLEKDNQLKDVLAHEKQLTISNLGLIKKLRETAPKDCEPYIDSTVTYYNEIMEVKDSSYAVLFEKLLVTDSLSLVKDSVIIELNVQADVQGKVIEQVEADKKKAERKAKVAKFFNKVLVGAAVGFTAVVVYFTMVK